MEELKRGLSKGGSAAGKMERPVDGAPSRTLSLAMHRMGEW